VERRIQQAESNAVENPLPDLDRPIGVPASYTEHAKLMFDLQVLAMQGDITRVCSFQLARETSNRTYFAGLAMWFSFWAFTAFTWYRDAYFLPIVWLALALLLRRPFRNLSKDPSPKHTGQMVGAMLRLVPLVDVLAMLANHVPPPQALAGTLWILPAFAIGKLFYST